MQHWYEPEHCIRVVSVGRGLDKNSLSRIHKQTVIYVAGDITALSTFFRAICEGYWTPNEHTSGVKAITTDGYKGRYLQVWRSTSLSTRMAIAKTKLQIKSGQPWTRSNFYNQLPWEDNEKTESQPNWWRKSILFPELRSRQYANRIMH